MAGDRSSSLFKEHARLFGIGVYKGINTLVDEVHNAKDNVLAVYENSSDGTVEPVDPDRNLQDFWDFGTMLIDREIAFEAYDYISVANTVNGNVVEPNGNLRLTAGNEITLVSIQV
ncbi:hypothetical protein [Ulvibacterium marinum]|uniref:hypothetical protein n=1 Tax=Ulvibacterium marinum TaxID=2419782 RepID=UPI002495021B|nr:hypothetical protein [Ulvibacterium marinum]